MRLDERVSLVGSGKIGFSLTNDFDCHMFLVNCGEESILVDSGAGLESNQVINNIQAEGVALSRVRHLFITHTHADHAGGAAYLRKELGVKVCVSETAADDLRKGDEKAISLDVARARGHYPADYRFPPSEVDVALSDGQSFRVGDCQVTAVETPGHSRGHMCFHIVAGGKKYLISGDTVFYGGRILLLNTWDCSIPDYARSLGKLSELPVDALLPAHDMPCFRDGQRHVKAAHEVFSKLGIPPNLTQSFLIC